MGIAQKLMDSMYSFMKEKNVARLLLEVRESNEPAKNLYIKNGFSPIAVRKNYYTKPTENAVVMEKYI
jgi:ribosomal-protein-alanine N-acetyltransferase